MAVSSRRKQENNPASLHAKIQMRQRILEYVRPARVLDLFCGHRTLWREVWQYADAYVGCDLSPWVTTEATRFACDNRRLLRCLDLTSFNVFDLDAFGSPWEQAIILAARRRWKKGEFGAVAITDGSALKTRWGALPNAMRILCGLDSQKIAPTMAGSIDLHRVAIAGFVQRAGLKVKKQWEAVGPPPACVYYAALVVEGTGA